MQATKLDLVMADNDERVLSIQTAARRLDVSTDTIRRRIRCGDLIAYRIGRSVRVDAADVERLLRPVDSVRGPGRTV